MTLFVVTFGVFVVFIVIGRRGQQPAANSGIDYRPKTIPPTLSRTDGQHVDLEKSADAALTAPARNDKLDIDNSGRREGELLKEKVTAFLEQVQVYERARSSLIGQRPNRYGTTVYFFVEKAAEAEIISLNKLFANLMESVPVGTALYDQATEQLGQQRDAFLKTAALSRLLKVQITTDPSKNVYVEATQLPDRSMIKFNPDGTFILPPMKLAPGSMGLNTDMFNTRFGHLMKLEIDSNQKTN